MGPHAEQDAPEAMRSSGRKRGLTVDDVGSSDPAPKRHSPSRRPALANSCYTVAMICPLPLEKAAAMAMLDEEHQPLRSRRSDDDNTYTLGSMHTEQGTHHVVIAGMGIGNIGILPASTVARHLQQTFPQARLCLVVGIGGGVPSKSHPLRLGDVVVGAKVIPYDSQRVLEHVIVRNGRALLPPDVLLNAASSLKAQHYVSESGIQSILGEKRDQLARFRRPSLQDRLFRSDYLHVSGETGDADGDSDSDPCNGCDLAMVHERSPRQSTSPSIHIGDIASGGTLLRSSHVRESLGRDELDVLCFEMETAGIMQVLPCLPIRGIADYADSHKNKRWQRYAAATAAAYARELLESIPPDSPGEEIALQPSTNLPIGGLSVPLPTRKDQFLASLRFDRMDLRRQGIDAPESSTCEWLLEEPHVVKWLDDTHFHEHNGLLLLTGNAGTGKSTCVNYLFDWHKRQRPPDGPAPLFASFFFHNRGVELEKSVVGMYRALLLQLFTGYSDLLDLLEQVSYQTVGAVVGQCPPLPTLKHLFREALLSLNGRSFVCYIDALDEGDVQDVRDMAAFFQKMAMDPAVRTTGSFRVLFSSRPYPVVTNQWRGAKFALQEAEGHRCDLELYVKDHLQHAEPMIKRTIIEKANGVFLWVKLVARIFFDEYLSRGRPCDLERLRNTPGELEHLFRDTLERDKSNSDEFIVAMTWILYARRPLGLVEFCSALDLGIDAQQHRPFSSSKVTSSNVAMLVKRVVSASKGLAEVIGNGKHTTVQLIHESAQEFLKSGGLDHVLGASNFQRPTICHKRLANYCLFLLQNSKPFERPRYAPIHIFRGWNTTAEHPLTLYALCWALDHARMSEHCIPPDFISNFPKHAVGWYEIQGYVRRHEEWSIMHECANGGYLALFKYGDWTEHLRATHLNIQTENYDSPLHLASRGGHLPVVQILVEWGADIDLRSIDDEDGGVTPLMSALREMEDSVAEWLISQGPNIHIVNAKGQTAIHIAARYDMQQVIPQLLARGAVLNQQDANSLTPLMTAVHYNSPQSARMLINAGATLTEPYGKKEIELVFAVQANDAHSCQLLATAGAELEVTAHEEATPLFIAAQLGFNMVCRTLINAGADIEAPDFAEKTPLMIAASRGHHTVCQTLINAGADIEARDGGERTPLLKAVELNQYAACEILLDAGAIVNVQDSEGQCALHITVVGGSEKMARLLIHHSANVNICTVDGETPLMGAVRDHNLSIVKLLLESGADLSAQNRWGWTVVGQAKGDVLEYLRTWHQNSERLSHVSLDVCNESSSRIFT